MVAGGNAPLLDKLAHLGSPILDARWNLRGGAVSESIHQSFLRHIHSMLQIADKDNKGIWLLGINLS